MAVSWGKLLLARFGQPFWTIAVTTEDLQIMLSCGRKSAVDVGELAEAKIQIGRRVFWNVEKIKTYLNLISS